MLALETNQVNLVLQALNLRMVRCLLMVWKVWALMGTPTLQLAERPMAVG